jgi:hypothetical protein
MKFMGLLDFLYKKYFFFKYLYIFVLIIGTLLNVKFVCKLFSSDRFITNNNTPSMPLFDAHLEGFFFL